LKGPVPPIVKLDKLVSVSVVTVTAAVSFCVKINEALLEVNEVIAKAPVPAVVKVDNPEPPANKGIVITPVLVLVMVNVADVSDKDKLVGPVPVKVKLVKELFVNPVLVPALPIDEAVILEEVLLTVKEVATSLDSVGIETAPVPDMFNVDKLESDNVVIALVCPPRDALLVIDSVPTPLATV